MKKQYLIWMILIVSSLIIFSCDEEDDPIPAVNPLTANAGEDKHTTTGKAEHSTIHGVSKVNLPEVRHRSTMEAAQLPVLLPIKLVYF